MVLMLRFTLGLLILLYAADTADIQIPAEDIANAADPPKLNQKPNNNTIEEIRKNNSKEITYQDVENIVKPYKFSTEPSNQNSTKLKQSEPYGEKEKSKDESSRIGNGRSFDIDIEKYISPDFHNAVYTLPNSKQQQEENSEEIRTRSTEMSSSFESLELTTPKTPFFDKKFKQTVDQVNRKLSEFHESESENLTNASTYNSSNNNFIEESDSSPRDTKLEYKIFENDELNKTKTHNGLHADVTQERHTVLNFESRHNETTSYIEKTTPSDDSNELHKENLKYLLGEENVNQVKKIETSIKPPGITKTDFHSTTIKYTITKPSTEKTDTGIINNKIESETIKSQHTTTPMTSNKPPTTLRGSIKFSDYQKLTTTGLPTTVEKNKTLEQVVQENQIIPIQVTAPIITTSTTTTTPLSVTTTTREPLSITTTAELSVATITKPLSVTTTTKPLSITTTTEQIDAVSFRNATEPLTTSTVETVPEKNNTIEPNEQQSTTVLVFVHPDTTKLETTTEYEDYDTTATTRTTVPVTSFPRGFTLQSTTEYFEPSTEIQTRKVSSTITTTETEETTTEALKTELPDTTTFNEVDVSSTEISSSSLENSYSTLISKTTTGKIETTTEVPTTLYVTTSSELRSSKEIKFTDTTVLMTTEDLGDTTPYVTESMKSTTTVVVSLPETSTKKEKLTTMESNTTTLVTSESPTKATVVESNPTKTLLENQTSEASTTTSKTTTTIINFVHVKNIDANHTTMYPDVLRPIEVYTTPVTVPEPISKTTTTESVTTDDGTSPSELDGHGGGNGAIVAIVISCVGGICLIALACLLIVMRNRQKRFNSLQRCVPVSLDDYSVDNVSIFNSFRRKAAARDSKRSYGNPAFEDPVCVSHPLNFPAISKFAGNEEDVSAEYRDIPQIIARTSELPEGCETKNRYANVIPLPESRVFLGHIEGYRNSDYINANYVTGPKNIRKYYIACQAPMSNTVDDFWRMVWEQQCKVILMLTHLFENGVEKCFDYLPPSEVLDCHRLFGDYQVTLKKREVKEKYIISSIQLKNMVSNSWREVTHFWYMGWPEKGVPTEANSIIAFLIEARSFMKSATIDKKSAVSDGMNGTSSAEVNPVVVHCSPGTGRTGAVITCDIAIREFEQTRQVDIPKIVYRIRRDRASAVQTKEQYAFIYKVVDLYATKLAGGSLESI